MHVSRLIYARHQAGEELAQPACDRGARGYFGWKRGAVLEVRENERGEAILDYLISVATGEALTQAELKGKKSSSPGNKASLWKINRSIRTCTDFQAHMQTIPVTQSA